MSAQRCNISSVISPKYRLLGRKSPYWQNDIPYVKVAFLSLLLVPYAPPVFAHARWFVDDRAIQLHPTVVLDVLYPSIVIGVIAFVLGALCLEVIGRTAPWLYRLTLQPVVLPHMLGWRILAAVFGITLIANSMTQDFIAPNLVMNEGFVFKALALLQIFVGAMFVAQTRIATASVIVLLLPFVCLALYSLPLTVDYAFELAAVGIGLFLTAPALADDERRFGWSWIPGAGSGEQSIGPIPAAHAARERQAVMYLRVMFGIQLIVLAAHDKLLQPGVSLAFVDANTFVNFPALLGVPGFTNMHFVFAAGVAEVVCGALLIANIATRMVAMILACMFILTGLAFGLSEMAGHLPIIALLGILIAHGSEGSVDEARLAKWRFGSMTAAGATLAVLIGTFVMGAKGEATEFVELSAITVVSPNPALVVPSALYDRFAAGLQREPMLMFGELKGADGAVRDMLAKGNRGEPVGKDELAFGLFNLSVRYETTYGADATSQWLRFAHLTASCTPDEAQAFRDVTSSGEWKTILGKTSQPMAALLLPIARHAAEAFTHEPMDPTDATAWADIAKRAPRSGANYVHTHVLASIVRILTAEAAPRGVSQPQPRPQAPGTGRNPAHERQAGL